MSYSWLLMDSWFYVLYGCLFSYIMISLAKLSKHVLSVQDTGSYIAVILGTVVVIVKRKFDTFMESELVRLQGVKLTRRTRLGIIDSVTHFEVILTI